MKKPKIKFSGDWKGLLLNHGEKAVVGAAALSVIFFAWSAIGREGLDSSRQPAAIETLAVRAREHIQKAQEMEAKEAFDPTGYLEKEKLAVEPFALAKSVNPRLFEPKLKRSDPKLFTVQQLEVTAGFGAIALKDPAALRGLVGGEIVE